MYVTFRLPCLQVPGGINDVRPKFYLPRKDGDRSYLVPASLGIPGIQVELSSLAPFPKVTNKFIGAQVFPRFSVSRVTAATHQL